MTTWEIINPSDHYTMECDDFAVATVATLMLGEGQFGLQEEGEGDREVPLLLLFDDPNDWTRVQFDCTVAELVERTDSLAVAAALESVLIGKRRAYQAAIELIPEDKRGEFRDRWHDDHRSSLSDIGSYAWSLARALRDRCKTLARELTDEIGTDDDG